MTKQVFRLKGLECARCISKIEDEINKIQDIRSAKMSFLTSKLTVEHNSNNEDDLLKSIRKIMHNYEPDVKVCELSKP